MKKGQMKCVAIINPKAAKLNFSSVKFSLKIFVIRAFL